MTSIKLNRKSRNKRKSCKKMSFRKKSTTKKHKKCKKCFKGGMMNENNNGEEECPLCLTQINTQDDLIMFRNLFQCQHHYHKECIIEYVKTTKETNGNIFQIVCPLCRADLTNYGNLNDGHHIIERISTILDIYDRRTRRNMFRDLLQYDYPYDANEEAEDRVFRLFIFPLLRIMFLEYHTYPVISQGRTFVMTAFVMTGNDARLFLIREYESYRGVAYVHFFANLLIGFYSPARMERRVAFLNAFLLFIILTFDNIHTDLPTEININLIIPELISMFGRFVANSIGFGNYNPNLPDRQLGGATNATTIQNNKRSITFKITSMEDVKEFLNIVDKNKTKLESLLDKVPFTLTALFPEVEYTPELVQKLRPLIKN